MKKGTFQIIVAHGFSKKSVYKIRGEIEPKYLQCMGTTFFFHGKRKVFLDAIADKRIPSSS